MVQGFRLPLLQTPVQSKPPPEIHLAADQTALITTEVEELIRKGAISPALQAPEGFVSQLFLVPKKDGGFRPVINLKALHTFIQEEHYKMENFHMIKELVRPQEWLVKVDLKDAYFLVPVHPDHHRFLQFQWLGQTYQFCCLPFGLSCAPRVFTKLMKPVVAFLRERGMRLIIYLDDILVISSSQEEAREYVLLIRDLFSSLGLINNEKKSQLVPSQEVVFLGYLISTVTMNISLPSEKMRKIQQEATHLLKAASVSIQQIAAFIGMTNAAKQAIPMAPMYHRQLQALINRVIPLAGSELQAMRQSYHNQVELTVEAREELTLWSQAARNHNAAPIIIPPPDLVIETDASLVGWGARCLDQRTGGLWSVKEQELHINALELTAVLLAIQTFTKERKHQHILVRTDNTTAKSYINHIGGTHSPTVNAITLSIWNWCLEHHLHLSAEYFPGVENQIVDAESRHSEDRCDWMLHPQVFEQINSLMGPLDVDLFASRLTHQLPKFFSWKPDLEAEATDAFTQSWSQIHGYANPPWCLILTALIKICWEEVRIVLVAPVWKTQPWYPLLLDMLTDVPCLLPHREDLVISLSEREFIMPTGVPQLAAWPLSGKSADRVAFQQKLHSGLSFVAFQVNIIL